MEGIVHCRCVGLCRRSKCFIWGSSPIQTSKFPSFLVRFFYYRVCIIVASSRRFFTKTHFIAIDRDWLCVEMGWTFSSQVHFCTKGGGICKVPSLLVCEATSDTARQTGIKISILHSSPLVKSRHQGT